MWLKQMVIDGFKSYAQRTVISDWDRHFTAITGLNGSGKSNILDAICFVLGITNLSQVRVENLQQLVYKEGQARVTKASVSLIFDNRDESESPIGYEDFDEIVVTRQVVIGGRNKYMINGQTAQLNRIRDLFHSVQLDVNNPHFLIMQGRITKVLNMKPNEILSMIQEAAGTKMYENKKLQAIKTMNKKQIKVNEINQILQNEITPQLEKLRKEKQYYLKWTKNNQEIDKLNRLIIICKYRNNIKGRRNYEITIKKLQESINETNGQMEFLKDDIEKIKNQIQHKQTLKINNQNGKIQQLTIDFNENNKKLKSFQQQFKNEKDNILRETKELKSIEKQCKNLNDNLIKNKNEQFIKCQDEFKKASEKYKYLQDRITSLESQQLGIGINDKNKNDDGNNGSLAKQLMETKKNKSQYQSQIRNCKNKIKGIKKELIKLNKEIKAYNNNNNDLQNEYKQKENELNRLKNSVMDIDNDDDNKDDEDVAYNLEKEIHSKNQLLYKLQGEINTLNRNAMQQFNFEYTNPYNNFNRNSVYGKLGNLFEVKSSEFCKAIEICAGGRLYNVVVDTNETGKHLLNNGKLRKRVTIIPLNKIASHTISDVIVNKAKEIVGEEHCHLALDLVGYNPELEAAMKYVFGNVFVCTDMNSAKEVAFNHDIRCKSVTMDGDVFNPQGLLTGGSNQQRDSILLNIQKFKTKKHQYMNEQNQIKILREKLHKFNAENEKRNQIKQKIELLTHELNVLKDRINDSAFSDLEKRIKELEEELNKQENEILADLERKLNITKQKEIDLQQDLKNYEQKKNDQIVHVKKEITKCKKELNALEKSLKNKTENKNRITQEMDDLKEEYENNTKQIETLNKSISEYQEKCKEIETELNKIKTENKEIKKELKIEHDKITKQDNELKKLQKIVNKNEKQYDEMDIDQVKKKSELENKKKQIKINNNVNEKLLSDYPWLAQEKINFDQNDDDEIDDDEKNNKEKESEQEIIMKKNKLNEEQSVLNNRINHKVMSMFERAENEYRDLIKKREIIRNDKKKIESVIRELDKKKEDTLESTYKKVNEHFGNIFSKLLPGTQCKLSKINEENVLDGLEVKVAFNNNNNNNNNNHNNKENENLNNNNSDLTQWKESLSELSGGQRSLLALSLILSLLLFKPAPLYILDEIDAALDLSHTQNIGILISKYFTKSQFIVVSLKEGMFTNANVIFRTSFIDGLSTVKRTVGSGLAKK